MGEFEKFVVMPEAVVAVARLERDDNNSTWNPVDRVEIAGRPVGFREEGMSSVLHPFIYFTHWRRLKGIFT